VLLIVVRSVLIAACAGWVACVALLWLFQERLVFPASASPLAEPPERGGVRFALAELNVPDGLTLRFIHAPPGPGKPVILFFHGNGGRADSEAPGLVPFAQRGFGFVAAEYRGYAGNPGTPSESGLVADGAAYVAWIQRHHPDSRIVLWGESLGTGVAVQLAAARPRDFAGVILDAPFTSLAEAGARQFPWVPVRTLIRHRFDSLSRMERLTPPVLVVHGEADSVVPVAMGRAILAAAPCPAGGIFIPGIGHTAFWQDRSGTVLHAIRGFLDEMAAGGAACRDGDDVR
jgi:fermentation-respiration switch protein FrsA (DUF1100 family)